MQLIGVCQVAIVRNGNGAFDIAHDERLRIFTYARAGRRIADMGTGHLAGEFIQRFFVEGLTDKAHAFGVCHHPAVIDNNPAAFLAAVLLCEQRIVRCIRNIDGTIRTTNAEYTAFFMRLPVWSKRTGQGYSSSTV